MIEKNGDDLKQYGSNLQKIYALLRERILHKKDFEKQKGLLRRDGFTQLIDDLLNMVDFMLPLETRIELWYIVFELLPYTYPEKDLDFAFNIYPRYELACIIGTGYVLGGYSNKRKKKNIIIKAVKGQRSTPEMKKLFQEIVSSDYREEFIQRTKALLEETRTIRGIAPKSEKRSSQQIEEDFNFGFSWIGFHVPSD